MLRPSALQCRVLKRMAAGWLLEDDISRTDSAALVHGSKKEAIKTGTVRALLAAGLIETKRFAWPVRTYRLARVKPV